MLECSNNPSTLVRCVNDFRITVPDALIPRKKGVNKSLHSINITKKATPNETISVNTSVEYVKQLEDELLKLRIVNSY